MANQTTVKKTSSKAQTEKPIQKPENWDAYEFEYIGDRVKEARISTGKTREEMATKFGISLAQYSNIEREASSSLKVLCSVINYLAEKHQINPAWIFLKDNNGVPFHLEETKTIDSMVAELNKLVSPHGMMVNLVSKA